MSLLTEKTVGELLEYNFFIPSYQRGYRWTEQQIEDLLEDVWDFIKKSKTTNEWYCLQPIVVKKGVNGLYEVLDGQQRLTSIFLILKHLEKFVESESKNFQIEFETRNTESSNSKEFLQNIESKLEKEANTNIDYFYIFNAHQKIKSWFQEKANQGNNSISSKFITPFLEETKVIWYEVDNDKDAIEIFTRINMGKIALTNSELIKALFLNSSNFKDIDNHGIKMKQFEIASEWDRIEYTLQNDELWLFINNITEKILPTRIECVFDIMYQSAKKDCIETNYRKVNKIGTIDEVNKRRENGHLTFDEKYGVDKYKTFRFFSKKFKIKSKEGIDNNWNEIKRTFQTIEEWFTDRELYHKIGYLISTGTTIVTLFKEANLKKKKEFKISLDVRITEIVKCDDFENLVYPNGLVRKILLLHNIQTMLNNDKENTRFPFNRYKEEKWDIEHIHATATDVKVEEKNQQKWLKNNYVKTVNHNNVELDDKINLILIGNSTEEVNFKLIIEYVLGGEDDNGIRNLCLLDSGTNRSYKNDSFKNKRSKIIENEKNGTFIPVCTRNVFMKYYSNELKDLELWNENDRVEYANNIKEVIFTTKNKN